MIILCAIILFITYTASQIANLLNVKIGKRIGKLISIALYLGVGAFWTMLWRVISKAPVLTTDVPALIYSSINGVFNILIVLTLMKIIENIGLGSMWATTTAGQFLMAIILDNKAEIQPRKLFALILIICGACYFVSLDLLKNKSNKPIKKQAVFLALGVLAGYGQMAMEYVNTISSDVIGVSGSVFCYLFSGAIIALVLILFSSIKNAKQISFCISDFFPGTVNALVVILPVFMIPYLGITTYTAIRFVASCVASVLCDTFGIFGMKKIKISTSRIFGSFLMLIGAGLFM